MNKEHYNTWVELSSGAYRHNIDLFRKLVGPSVKISAVIKSNAYGHGVLNIARLALNCGVEYFCVHSLDEAIYLCDQGIKSSILIMGHIPLSRLHEVANHNFNCVMYNMESIKKLDKLSAMKGRKAKIHLKIETGMNRQGIISKDIRKYLSCLVQCSSLELEGIYTHFANIDNTSDSEYADYQLRNFKKSIDMFRQLGLHNTKIHCGCTAAILFFPETHFNMVRLGIGQYGLWPSHETRLSFIIRNGDLPEYVLKPVMRWKTRISQIKSVLKNNYIGYGCTFKTNRNTVVAVLPVGYADGYDRLLSNRGYVIIRGMRANVLGRVCMNIMMVDVTDIPSVKLEDEVVLIGDGKDGSATADALAGMTGTINYEIVTRVNWDIPRIIVQ